MFQADYGTPDAAYQGMLKAVLDDPEHTVGPRGLRTNEVTNAMFWIRNPSDAPIVTANQGRNAIIERYTKAEFSLFERGVNDTTAFAEHARFWAEIGDPGGTMNSAYGRIIWYDKRLPGGITPWTWAKEALLKDLNTRQAILLFLRPDHLKPTKDLVCTCHGHFMVRNSKLNLTMVMRSNDVVKGTVYDVPWFMHVQRRMAEEIKVSVGHYTHIAHSLHVYEKDVKLARSMIHHV